MIHDGSCLGCSSGSRKFVAPSHTAANTGGALTYSRIRRAEHNANSVAIVMTGFEL